MAETIGTVASIIQLVDTALKAREYTQDFIHAPQEQKDLLKEMEYLRALLEQLSARIADDRNTPSSGILQQMDRPLGDFRLMMTRCNKKLEPGGGPVPKFSKRLTWTLWDKKEAKDYLEKFEQFKSLLNAWLLVDIRDMGQQHHGIVLRSVDNVASLINVQQDTISEQQRQMTLIHGTVLEAVDNVANVVDRNVINIGDTISGHINSAERAQIIDWFSPINFFLRHADVSRARQPGTGRWLLVDPQFMEWESGIGGTLWCYGMPGAGKTVLTSMVVDHLNSRAQNENIGVACIYLNHKEASIQTLSHLLSSLWRQLILGREIAGPVWDLYQRHSEKRTSPSVDEIHKVVCTAITQWSKVYIVVDAVDEYSENQRRFLFQYLVRMGLNTNLLITARSHLTPDGCLPCIKTLEVRAKKDDLQTYVDAHIHMSSRLSRHVQTRPELREEIHLKVTNGVDGMFLLAKLHIESLATKSTIKAVRAALINLPKNLKETYENAMKRIEDQNQEDREIARCALTWVANAKRPLTVSEILVALAIEPDTRCLDEDNLLDIDMILSVCAGLIIVDAEGSAVRLVHYTTQQYLDSIQAQQFPDAQIQITHSLLTFLAFDEFVPLSLAAVHSPPPLLEYCAYVLMHACGKPEKLLRTMIIEFLCCIGSTDQLPNVSKKWIWSLPPWNSSYFPPQPSALWIAAGANLVEIARFLIEEGHSPQDPDIIKGNALQVASYYGHLEIVKLLLENGADVHAPGESFSALHAACFEGHKDIIQLLISNGAQDVNGDALKNASFHGHNKIVEMLIEIRAYIPAIAGDALLAAATNGHADIIQLLLEKGADVNARGGSRSTALLEASSQGLEDLVLLLIQNGADVNAQRIEYGHALHQASSRGHTNIVHQLIVHGADVDAPVGKYGCPLKTAASKGHKDIVGLLIDNGADVNAHSGDDGSALQAACSLGYEDIVHFLIKSGADVNAHSGIYGNALQVASSRGHRDIVQLLIDNNADVNMQEGYYGSALQEASFKGHEDIVQTLITYGADVNSLGIPYGSALGAASIAGNLNIIQLLIANGADVNAQGPYHGSALQAVSSKGHTNIVPLLLENGAALKYDGGLLQPAIPDNADNIVPVLETDVKALKTLDSNPLARATLREKPPRHPKNPHRKNTLLAPVKHPQMTAPRQV